MEIFMTEKKGARGSAIVKLVIWAIVAAILIAIFASVMAMRDTSGFDGVIRISGFSLLGGEFYSDGDSYNVGNREYSERVTDIDVSWTSGSVSFGVWDGDTVKLEETGMGENEDNFMRSKVKDGKLIIKYVRSGLSFFKTYPEKDLTVLLPKSMASSLGDVEIETASANVTFSGLYLENLYDSNLKNGFVLDSFDFDGASGDLNVGGMTADEVDVDVVSGKVTLDGDFERADIDSTSGDVVVWGDPKALNIDSVSGRVEIHRFAIEGYHTTNISTVSGEVDIHANALSHLDIETVSGNIYVDMKDYGEGFVAELDSVSGIMTCNGSSGRRYTLGNGGGSFDFETVSGNVTIKLR